MYKLKNSAVIVWVFKFAREVCMVSGALPQIFPLKSKVFPPDCDITPYYLFTRYLFQKLVEHPRSSILIYKSGCKAERFVYVLKTVDFHCRRTLSLYNSTRSTSVQGDHFHSVYFAAGKEAH